jgi:hypothetical protein
VRVQNPQNTERAFVKFSSRNKKKNFSCSFDFGYTLEKKNTGTRRIQTANFSEKMQRILQQTFYVQNICGTFYGFLDIIYTRSVCVCVCVRARARVRAYISIIVK